MFVYFCVLYICFLLVLFLCLVCIFFSFLDNKILKLLFVVAVWPGQCFLFVLVSFSLQLIFNHPKINCDFQLLCDSSCCNSFSQMAEWAEDDSNHEQEANDFSPHESLTQHLANSTDVEVFPMVSFFCFPQIAPAFMIYQNFIESLIFFCCSSIWSKWEKLMYVLRDSWVAKVEEKYHSR